MSQENVDTVRRMFDAFNALDAEAVRDYWTTDAEWRPAFTGGGLVENAVYRGHDGLRDYLALQNETWERVSARLVTIRDLGDRVLVKVDLDAVGRASGVPVRRDTWNVFEMRGGKAAIGRVYTTEREALEAAGLTEEAMSQENVNVVRRIYEATARRDTESVLSLYDPDVEWDMTHHPYGEMFEGDALRHGHAGLRAWLREWYEAFEYFGHIPDELIDVGEHVVSVGIDRARGRESGVQVEMQTAGVWTVRDGRVVRVVWFPSRHAALAAAGAPE